MYKYNADVMKYKILGNENQKIFITVLFYRNLCIQHSSKVTNGVRINAKIYFITKYFCTFHKFLEILGNKKGL